MTTLVRKIERWGVRTFLFVVGLFSKETKRRAKRLLFIGSVNSVMVRNGIMTHSSTEAVKGDILNLHDARALDLAQTFSEDFWDAERIKDIMLSQRKMASSGQTIHLSMNEAICVTDKVIEASPRWLRYDTPDMRRDIMEMLLYNAVKV